MSNSHIKAMPRRQWLATAAVLAVTGFQRTALAQATLVQVWKDPNCGCCQLWVEHLQASGFKVEVRDVGNTAARKRLGMPEQLGSCHTASVGGYVIEGHVPAADIHRLLKERPVALGLSVPGMPIGSPGMDGPEYKGRKDAYDVLLVQKDGSSRVYQSYFKPVGQSPREGFMNTQHSTGAAATLRRAGEGTEEGGGQRTAHGLGHLPRQERARRTDERARDDEEDVAQDVAGCRHGQEHD